MYYDDGISGSGTFLAWCAWGGGTMLVVGLYVGSMSTEAVERHERWRRDHPDENHE